MIRLFTTWYDEANPQRAAEYAKCLAHNLDCKAIDEVLVIVEGSGSGLLDSPRLQRRALDRRPRYQDFFAWINEISSLNDVSIVANTDIWFGDQIAVVDETLFGKRCYALARWDAEALFDRNDSQDAWIFRGPVEGVNADFPIGVPRCDNRILFELQAAGFEVENPSFSLIAHHVHAGKRGEYAGEGEAAFVSPPYRYLWPHNLWSAGRTHFHNRKNPDRRLEWRVDSRRLAATLPGRMIGKLGRMLTAPSR